MNGLWVTGNSPWRQHPIPRLMSSQNRFGWSRRRSSTRRRLHVVVHASRATLAAAAASAMAMLRRSLGVMWSSRRFY